MTKTEFQTTIQVLVQHINYGNHLGHDSLISLLHEARVRLFATKGKDERCIILKNLHVEYKGEAFLHDELEFSLSYEQKGPCSLEIRYVVKRAEILIAEASSEVVFFDYEKRKIVRGSL